jgi:MtN3 and saliva related transmembrane protein
MASRWRGSRCGWPYGVALGQWPLIATNGICLVLAAFILVMKILPASGKRAVADALDPSARAPGP